LPLIKKQTENEKNKSYFRVIIYDFNLVFK